MNSATIIPYKKFRTGYTYHEVSDMLWYSDEWHKAHHTKRRHAVLGKWREIKQEMYDRYMNEIQASATEPGSLEPIPF